MDINKFKILIPVLNFSRSGGSRVLAQLANYWLMGGHEVHFVTYFESNTPYFPISSDIIWINTNGDIVRKNQADYNLENSGFKRIVALYRFLKKNSKNFDVVLANHNLTAWPVCFGSKSRNFYYIQAYEVDFSSSQSFKNCLKKMVAYITYFLPLHRIVNAEIYKNYKNIRSNNVIFPGLDLSIFYPKTTKIFQKDKQFVVGCIGRLEELKGTDDVLEAVKILHRKNYDIKFKVAFNPVNYDRYELLSPDGDNNLADFYRDLDVLVAPCHVQLGAVHYPVIEAMSCKTTVITTGYYPATNENAYIVPIKSPEAIAETIISILNNYEQAIYKTEKAYKAIQQFDWKIVSSKFIDVFNNEIKRIKK